MELPVLSANANADPNPAPNADNTSAPPADPPADPPVTGGITGNEDPPADPPADPPIDGGVPVEYKLEVPEGAKLDAGYTDEIATFAKEQGLSNDAAQAVLNRDAQLVANAQKVQEEAVQTQRRQWIENLKADKEFGGTRYEETMALAQRVWKRYGPQDANLGPFGDSDVLIKLCAAIGRDLKEDSLITGGAVVKAKPKTVANRMYPNLK